MVQWCRSGAIRSYTKASCGGFPNLLIEMIQSCIATAHLSKPLEVLSGVDVSPPGLDVTCERYGQVTSQRKMKRNTKLRTYELVRLCCPQQIQNYTEKYRNVENTFDAFMFFDKLRTCSVSVVASGIFFHASKSIC